MGEIPDDEAGVDFELQVSQLDDGASNAVPPAPNETARSLQDGGDDASSPTAPGHRQHTRQPRRLLRAGVTGLSVTLADVVILAGFPARTSRLARGFGTPVPTATLSPWADIILQAPFPGERCGYTVAQIALSISATTTVISPISCRQDDTPSITWQRRSHRPTAQ
jgi:hypothetical protein